MGSNFVICSLTFNPSRIGQAIVVRIALLNMLIATWNMNIKQCRLQTQNAGMRSGTVIASLKGISVENYCAGRIVSYPHWLVSVAQNVKGSRGRGEYSFLGLGVWR